MIHTSVSSDDRNEWESTASTRNPVSLQAIENADEAARALQGLRILQPPVAPDDGGNYSQQQRFSGSSPVGTATASAHGPLDPVLVAGLENARERMTLLKFEDQIVRFLKNSREPHLNFPPLSSYHRLIVHRLAQRCGLEHQTADYSPFENSSARVVTLFKTAQSAVPRILLIDLSADRQTPTVTPASAPRIMMRKRSAPRPGANNGRGNGADKATPTLQDRERAYAEARARIFGESNDGTAAESASSSSASPTTSSIQGGGSDSSITTGNSGSRHGSRQAAGPDGSRGFGRGRGDGFSGGISASQPRDSRPMKEILGVDESNEFSRASHLNATNAASWKESKVLWRNREQELNDPDFTRHHDAFRPRSSGGASSGSGSGGESPYHGNRFVSGVGFAHSDFHDRSYDRSCGFQRQQIGVLPPQPPPPMPMASPGRGRFYVGGPNHNNRLDTNLPQRSLYQQYHQQQQFQPHQLNPPPLIVMGRGGYGYPSPQNRPSARQGNWVPPPTSTRTVGGSGFIEDDFPPLGK